MSCDETLSEILSETSRGLFVKAELVSTSSEAEIPRAGPLAAKVTFCGISAARLRPKKGIWGGVFLFVSGGVSHT